MSWLRELGQDAAYYFGVGDGSERTRRSEQSRPTWTTVALGVLPVLVVALPVGRIIGAPGIDVGRPAPGTVV